ncbi:hypothetical protein DFJ73DRAFT_785103 [Zopfochytrium polystomum]|nr:hypothetical protein DFJ73DRAFT_785103 [Zopfochytrium polystomum]
MVEVDRSKDEALRLRLRPRLAVLTPANRPVTIAQKVLRSRPAQGATGGRNHRACSLRDQRSTTRPPFVPAPSSGTASSSQNKQPNSVGSDEAATTGSKARKPMPPVPMPAVGSSTKTSSSSFSSSSNTASQAIKNIRPQSSAPQRPKEQQDSVGADAVGTTDSQFPGQTPSRRPQLANPKPTIAPLAPSSSSSSSSASASTTARKRPRQPSSHPPGIPRQSLVFADTLIHGVQVVAKIALVRDRKIIGTHDSVTQRSKDSISQHMITAEWIDTFPLKLVKECNALGSKGYRCGSLPGFKFKEMG